MTEKPINFTSDEVRAILDGTKVQTRRPIPLLASESWLGVMKYEEEHMDDRPVYRMCLKMAPFQPGDVAWVRETFYYQRWLGIPLTGPQPVQYAADGHEECLEDWRKAPSIHMPRWASRITLAITDVRVQRVQDTSEDDCLAEGIYPIAHGKEGYYYAIKDGPPSHTDYCFPSDALRALWNSIYSNRYPWDGNPWCWCYTFRRVTP